MIEPDIIHWVGPAVTVGTVQRQRCLWCGALVLGRDLAEEMVPEGSPPPGLWDIGSMVAVKGGSQFLWQTQAQVQQDPGVPEKCCAQLDPAVTG